MFAVSSSGHKNALLSASGSDWPRLSRAGGTIIKTTVDHALMRGLDTAGPADASRSFLCLGTSVGKFPADSGREGSPGRDRASSLTQPWIDVLSAMTSFS